MMKTRLIAGLIATLGGTLLVPCRAQGLFDQINFRNAEKSGFGLYGVSVYSGYSTVDSQIPLPSLGQFGNRVDYGASASAGWQHHGETKNMSLMYSGTYGGLTLGSNYHSFSQSLLLNASRKFGQKWTVTISGSGQDTTLDQYLFQPLGFSVLSQLPANFNDFAAALGVGQFSSAQAANSLQQGAADLQSPLRTGLLGDRVISYSGQLSLEYQYSNRLSFHIAGFTAGGQNHYGGQEGTPVQNYTLPRTLGGMAGVGLNYSISPRTQLGLSVDENAIWSRYQSSFSTSLVASFGRKMGEHWFLQMNGGGTRTTFTKQLYGNARNLQAVGGGSLGFKVRAQTFAGSYQMTASDSYGFATGTNSYASGSWTWHRPGSRMSLSSSFGRNTLTNTGYLSLSGWQASSAFTFNTGFHSSIVGQYVYGDSASRFLGTPDGFRIQSVRLSLNWTPQLIAR